MATSLCDERTEQEVVSVGSGAMSAPFTSVSVLLERVAKSSWVNGALTMPDSRHPRAFDRIKWLSELSDALDEAHRLTTSLSRWEGGSAESAALRSRLKAAIAEVEALRRGLPQAASIIGPKRILRTSDHGIRGRRSNH